MGKKAPSRVDMYVVLDAKRMMPDQLVLPADYPPLHDVGEYQAYPAGGPKGAKIISRVDGPIEDIYTMHFLATGDLDGDATTFQPEAEKLFQLIALGVAAETYGAKLVDEILERVQEMIGAGLTHAELAGEVASMRKQAKKR